MALSLATKYRPKTLQDVVGQETIVKILDQQLKSNNIKNCYLFCGPSGCGKTTLGRILANEINKGQGYPIEIDAASNNSVDDVKSIIDASNTKSIMSEYKIYIIDECHSLSNQAWQAFLKTLEEPSNKTIFIFCTTEIQKVPVTILNRVQRFDLSKIDKVQILTRLEFICNQENIQFEEEGLKHIVKLSKGRMRDAIAYLEKVTCLTNIVSLEEVIKILDNLEYKNMFDLINSIIDMDSNKALQIINQIDSKGKDMKIFINEFTTFILDINKYLITKDLSLLNIPSFYEQEILYAIKVQEANKFYLSVLKELIKLKDQIRYETDVKSNLEITVLFLCK